MDMGISRKLKLNQLRLITAIAEHQQIGLAAEAMAITQPAASRMLAEIENLFGTKLFDRHAKGMAPTLAGQALVERAKVILINLRDLSAEITDISQGRVGVVSVGAVTGAALGLVLPAIQQLKSLSPRIEVQINVETSPVLLRNLREGINDFVLARLPAEGDVGDFDIVPAKSEAVNLLVRQGHPLLRYAGPLPLAELVAHEWVVQAHPVPIRQAVDSAFLQDGIVPPSRITTTTSLLVMMALMATSDAIAPVAREVADLLIGDDVGTKFKVLPVNRPIEVSPYYLLSLKGRIFSPASDQLKSLVVERLAEHRLSHPSP